MGIPFFFKYLSQKHGNNIFQRYVDVRCEYLCVDFNSLIHKCAQYQSKMVPYTSESNMRADIFRSIVRYTRNIIDIVKPSIKTFLAIDGVPPLAKIYQQRSRRYMSIKEKQYKDRLLPLSGGTTCVKWDSNVVTPGTAFMKDLSKHLAYAFKDDPSIDLSDWTVPDEGEHKIFKYIESCCVQNAVIYGMDADMVMLSLVRTTPNIVLMREREGINISDPQPQCFNFVSIAKLNRLLSRRSTIVSAHENGHIAEGNASTGHPSDDSSARFGDRIDDTNASNILDYVFLCLLAGNDFLPPLSHLQIINNDIELLLRAYDTVVLVENKRIVSRIPKNGFHVDFGMVLKLLNELKATEDVGMNRACDIYYNKSVSTRFVNLSAEELIDHQWKNYPATHKFRQGLIDPNKAGWRMTYYHNLLGQHAVVSKAIEKYVEGLEWNIRYYITNTTPDAQWFYEYTYSPTILDCCNFLEANKGIPHNWSSKYMQFPRITPLMQLLCVISPMNQKIIPRKYQKIMTDVKYGCLHLFPHDFEVLTFLKVFAWECHPRLAPIDVHMIATAIANVKKDDKSIEC